MKINIQKNQLLQHDNRLVRVLDSTTDKVFIIDCIKRTMPVWTDVKKNSSYLRKSNNCRMFPTDMTG